jgi:hypothetical protein
MKTDTEDDTNPPWYSLIDGRQPDAVLGGSIFLFRIDPHRAD